MRVLLDSHVFLWWSIDSPRLSAAAREIIASPRSEIFVSLVTAWELAIKEGLGRLRLP